jgi:hypothetical protein
MTETLLFGDGIPSLTLWVAGAGSVVLVLIALLLQRAARGWMFCERTQALQRHTARVEASWRQAM